MEILFFRCTYNCKICCNLSLKGICTVSLVDKASDFESKGQWFKSQQFLQFLSVGKSSSGYFLHFLANQNGTRKTNNNNNTGHKAFPISNAPYRGCLE